MQNKGFVKVFALLLTLVCLFYLSFSFVTGYHMNKAANDPKGEQHYLDSMQNEKVWLGVYTLKQSREMEIGLGLDLKGGMYVIMEVSVPDIVKALADHKSDVAFNQAVEAARVASITSQSDYITLFVDEYKKLAPEGSLAAIFATQQLKDKVNTRSTDSEVIAVLRSEVQAAIDNSFNVLRTRIDRFGVVQPNIQTLEGSMGRIMIELPGVKEPERVRKLLQGSANLEFWDTYNASEIVPALMSADAKLAAVAQATAPATQEAAAEAAETAEPAAATEEVADADIEAAIAGENAAAYVLEGREGAGTENSEKRIKIVPVAGVRYTVPTYIRPDKMPEKLTVRFRVANVYKNCSIETCFDDKTVQKKKRAVVAPGEMENVIIRREDILKLKPEQITIGLNTEGSDNDGK